MSRPSDPRGKSGPASSADHVWTVQAAREIDVAVDIKVVASGIAMERAADGSYRRTLHASLALSPKKRTGAEGELVVDLSKWPEQIERKLLGDRRRMAIAVSCLPAEYDAAVKGQRPRPREEHRNRTVRIARRHGDAGRIDALTACWQQLMGATSGANDDPWGGMQALAEAASTGAGAAGAATEIVSVPRADMALFLQAWRARVVLGALSSKGRPAIEPGCDPIGDLEQWILESADLALLAGAAPGKEAAEKQRIDDVKKELHDHFKKRKGYHATDISSCDAIEKLDAFRCSPTQCAAPLKVVEPAATQNESAIHAMFGLHRSLHEAQLSLDDHLKAQIEGKPQAPGAPKPQDEPRPAPGVTWQRPPVSEEPKKISQEVAKARLYALQAIPALARVFRFVIDIKAELGDMEALGQPADALQAPVRTIEGHFTSMAGALSTLAPARIHEFDTVDSEIADHESIPSSDQTHPVTYYLFLSAAGERQQPWTTAKLRVPTGKAWRGGVAATHSHRRILAPGHFFPCTMEEIELAAVLLKYPDKAGDTPRAACRECRDADGVTITRYMLPAVRDGRIVQFDGVLDLGAGRRAADPSERRPRYDIVSLDVLSAMESQINLARAEQARREPDRESPVQQRKPGSDAVEPAVDERPTYRTMGLMLVDRWRAAAAAEAAADREHRRTQHAEGMAVFDATALTVGYRIDIGARPAGARPEDRRKFHKFRALGNRVVTYDYPKDPGLIERELHELGYGKDGITREARIRLDSTPIVPGVRMSGAQRFPEEILASWEGDPLGLQCVRDWNGDDVVIDVDPGEELGVSRHYELPDDEGSGYRIPYLLFGRRYRYGLRAELLGGVTTPLARARAIYEEAAGGMLALPEPASLPSDGDLADSARTKGRRFLRHERILSPHVLAPEAEVAEARRKGYGRLRDQSSREAIVRTATRTGNVGDSTFDTPLVRRMFVAPGVSQNFAELHGELRSGLAVSGAVLVRNPRNPQEISRTRIQRPLDGLRNVAYNYSNGGFPVRSFANDIVYLAPEQQQAGRSTKETADQPPLSRDPVFVLSPRDPKDMEAAHLARPEPYFPDPAAECMVFAVRRRRYRLGETSAAPADPSLQRQNDYLPGKPVVVTLTDPLLRYPDRLAVVLDVLRGGDRNRTLSQPAVLKEDRSGTGTLGRDGFSSAKLTAKTLDSGLVPARRVVATLAPGDEFELDVWCVPSLDRLEKWFDVVESSALLAVARSCLQEAGNDPKQSLSNLNLACLTGIEHILGRTDFATFRRRLANWSRRRTGVQECGMGALHLPAESVRRDIAGLLRERMLQRPVPEVAAMRTLRIAHAVSRPNFAPSFRGWGASGSAAQPYTANLRQTGLEVIRKTFKTDEERRNFVMENHVSYWHQEKPDCPTHDLFATDLLVGGSIDADLDTAHAATIFARLAHPMTHRFDDPRRGRPQEELGTGLDKKKYMNPGAPDRTRPDLYGFIVDARTGRIAFDRQPVVLAQIEGLDPSDDLAQRRIGTESVDILRDPRTGAMRIDLKRYVPSDDKARRMLLELETHTRFRSDFEVVAPPGQADALDNALDEDAGKKWVTSRKSAPASVLGDDGQSGFELWIPATRRPQPIDPQSILPTFVWSLAENPSASVVDVERRMLARLRFRRPWFSSGEGEKLGIVLWPPQIFDEPPTRTEFAPSHFALTEHEAAIIEKELATGAGYITRAGADPIRSGGAYDEGRFMPLEAFRDAFPKDGEPARAARVKSIAMPLPKDPEKNLQSSLHVSLLTYEPLFDPIDELWYVDVEIAARDFPDGWVRFGLVRYQEHAIRGEEVSEPTTTMVQILPRRHASVATRRTPRGGYRVTLTVEGAGSLAAAEDRDLVVLEEDKRRMQRPVVRPTLLKRTCSSPGGPEEVRTLYSWETADAGRPMYVEPFRSDAGLLWTHSFSFDEDPKPTELACYEIVFDEVDLRPAATPSETATSTLIASGPRFAARVRVPGAAS